jgi:hypothetical protein
MSHENVEVVKAGFEAWNTADTPAPHQPVRVDHPTSTPCPDSVVGVVSPN